MKKLFISVSIILFLTSIILCFTSKEVAGVAFLICASIFLFLAFISELAKFIKEINLKKGIITMQEFIDMFKCMVLNIKK